MKKVSYGAALIVMAGGALCLLAHDTDEKIPAPGFRPECEQAAAFLKSVGTCQIAVLPTVWHTQDSLSYSAVSQKTILTHLSDKKIAEPNVCTLELDLSKTQGPAQWGFFQSGMKLMGEQVKPLNTNTDYYMAVELLIPPTRDDHLAVFGIHVYILNHAGENAFSFLLNSHHQLFVDAKLTAEKATEKAKAKLMAASTQVTLTALDQQIQQAKKAEQ